MAFQINFSLPMHLIPCPKILYTELIKFVVFVNKCLVETKPRVCTTSLKIQMQCMQQYKEPMIYWQIKKSLRTQLLQENNPLIITIRYACFFMLCVSLFTCGTAFYQCNLMFVCDALLDLVPFVFIAQLISFPL